ncbi:MAG TPA: PqqD family peptide modification chaperone [Pyrinomonadaceae bacterium]|nr:PqqD family peptide modification chaperone [Pyrinomonadaceae bacterium]
MNKLPRVRKDKLITRQVAGELLIYDQNREKAYCLNRSAALIWSYCNGKTTIAEISRVVTSELNARVDERTVWLAIIQFGKDNLLEEKLTVPPPMRQGMNRRELARALGVAAMVAIPVVTSIVAPTAAQAASCRQTGETCSSSAECCSGVCNNSICA